MSRPGLWVANGAPTDPDKMLSWRPGALTSFYDYLTPNRVWEYKQQHPDIPVIVRFQHPFQWQQDPAGWANWLGEQVSSKWPDLRGIDPYVYFANEMNLHYENGDNNPANQPNYETQEFYQSYADWVRMVAQRIKQQTPDMKLVTPPFAFGHHEDGAPDEDGVPTEGWAGYDYLADTIREYFDNIITFHAYWGYSAGSVHDWLYDPVLSSWYAFRWRRVLKLFEHRYNIQARVIIDEAGNFGAGDPDFTDQIIYHARGCLSDERVIAVTYFLWEDPTNSPGNLPNSWVQRTLNLDDHIARLAALPDIEPEPLGPTIRVLMPDGSVQVMLVEEYLRAVVPAEMYASWPLEALKAQAVASRSYAGYAILHPRHPNADICTDAAHCQAYNPDRINPNSDQAIRATANEVIEYAGQVADAVFSANCGGHTVGNEVGFAVPGQPPPPPIPYLRPVPCINPGPKQGHGVGLCQYGAHDMAEVNDDYVTILKHYYTDVNLSSEPQVGTGVIRGTVKDEAGRALADVRLALTREGWNGQTTSAADGTYSFSNLLPGTYSLEAVDHDVRRDGLVLAEGQQLVVDLTVPVQPTGWTMQIERGPGLPLIVGSMPRAGIQVSVEDPYGNIVNVVSGSKPEYGVGGWEVYATQVGTYRIQFLDQVFDVPMNGQFTHLTFSEAPTPPAQGIITGVLRDHAGVAQPGQQILLVAVGLSRTTTTGSDGAYRFDQLPAGSYTLSVAGTQLTQTIQIDGLGSVRVDLTLPSPPGPQTGGGWTMNITRGSGLPLLVGSLPEAGLAIQITDPIGATLQLTSGSKPEYGVGGFEIYAPRTGPYIIRFLDQTFTVPMSGQFTRVTFIRGAPAGTEARLVSKTLSRSEAEMWLQHFEADPQTRGLFSLEEP
jgi:hypothetical protein